MPDAYHVSGNTAPDIEPFALQIERLIHRQGNEAFVLHNNRRLSSAFQPIVSLLHRNLVGHEALLRAWDMRARQPISPMELFDALGTDAEVVHFDRLCRALHVKNSMLRGLNDTWLFLNITPNVVVQGRHYGSFFQQLLRRHRLAPQRVVIELVEDVIDDEGKLADAVAFFKELGCLVAIDDFGAGHSNFERIWRVQPDIVKLDRSFTVQVTRDARVRRIVSGLVTLIHEAGCLVLMEGLETEEEALIAMDADVDLAQGYFLGKPAAQPLGSAAVQPLFRQLEDAFQGRVQREKNRHSADVQQCVQQVEQCARLLSSGIDLPDVCRRLLETPGLQRCYLLDAKGEQLGHNIEPAIDRDELDRRFDPLSDTQNANWSRRPYFRRAIHRPGEVQMTRPYLSARDARYCVTLSVAYRFQDDIRVFCADLSWAGDRLCPSVCGY